jgi:hypothetical protein
MLGADGQHWLASGVGQSLQGHMRSEAVPLVKSRSVQGGAMAVLNNINDTVKDIERQAKTFVYGVVDFVRLRDQLAAYKDEPYVAAHKAARDLAPQEALDLLMHLVYKGEIYLDQPIKTDAKGRVIFPTPQERVLVRTTIAGVDYFQAAEKSKTKRGSDNAHKTPNFYPTPTFAIVLHRLAVFLRSDWA